MDNGSPDSTPLPNSAPSRMPGPASERLFVAIKVAESLAGPLANLQRDLAQAMPARAVRWSPPDHIHLTLLFFGQVPSARVSELRVALERAVHGTRPLQLGLREVGAFPSPRQPRVLWVGVDGDLAELAGLQVQIAAAGAPFVDSPETRDFHPHLTIGRVAGRDRRDASAVAQALAANPPVRLGTWLAREVTLIRSDLRPGGPVYTDVARFPLRSGLGG